MANKIYTTPEKLQAKVDEYFMDLIREIPRLDKKGRPAYDRYGVRIYDKEFKEKPSKGALATFLGLSQRALSDYAKREEYADVVEGAYDLIEHYLVQLLLSERKNMSGVIFYLKNAFGYSDKQDIKQEVELTGSLYTLTDKELHKRIDALLKKRNQK